MTQYDAYVINLATREDRWTNFQQSIAKAAPTINPMRFEAIQRKPGWIGCALSHIAIIEMAKEQNLPYVIVFEDDTSFIKPNFDSHFTKLITYLNDNNEWFIFNGNPSFCCYQPKQQVSLLHSDPNIVSFEYGKTTNFMIYSHRAYDKIIDLKSRYNYGGNSSQNAFDVIINNIPNKITALPYVTSQLAGKSDIENKFINYDRFILTEGMQFLHNAVFKKNWFLNNLDVRNHSNTKAYPTLQQNGPYRRQLFWYESPGMYHMQYLYIQRVSAIVR